MSPVHTTAQTEPLKPTESGQSKEVDITFFVACRNEQGNVGRALRELVETLRDYPYSYEILVFDDASTDQSIAEIKDFMQQNPDIDIALRCNAQPMGVSYNICDAAVQGRGRYFQFISGSFQNRREALCAVFDEVGNADLILTYLSPDKRVWHRKLLSRGYANLVNLVSGYNIRHYHGTPLFRRIDILRWHSYRSVGFYADMITRMLDEGITYIQVPTVCHERDRGRSRALRIRNLVSLLMGFASMLARRCSRGRTKSVELPLLKTAMAASITKSRTESETRAKSYADPMPLRPS